MSDVDLPPSLRPAEVQGSFRLVVGRADVAAAESMAEEASAQEHEGHERRMQQHQQVRTLRCLLAAGLVVSAGSCIVVRIVDCGKRQGLHSESLASASPGQPV